MTELDPKKHTKPFAFFLAVNKKELPLIALRTVLYGLGTLGTVGMAFYVGKVIDALQTHPEGLQYSVTLLLVCLVFHEAAYRLGHILEVRTHARIRARAKKALFSYTSKLSFGYFADRFAGQISHQVGTASSSMERMEEVVVNRFIDSAWLLVVSAATLISMYKPFGWMVACWFAVYMVGVYFLSKKITFYAEELAGQEANTTGTLVDMYTNISTVKVYSKDFDIDRVNAQIEKERRSQVSVGIWDVWTYAFQGFFAVVFGLIVFFATREGYHLGLISVGGIAAISAIALKIIEFVYATGHMISSFVRFRGECMQALKDVLVPPTVLDGAHRLASSWETVQVSCDHVQFSYSEHKSVLRDFSLDIPARQRVGIVGFSGAGKTTLMNLLLRFFDPEAGSILINGVDIKTIAQDSLRSHISFISQDTSLFHKSIAENIAYGTDGASRERIVEVAKMAYVDEFVSVLPDGYDTIVGDRGIKLSGGQRQRISIARAMLKDSPLFLLDEATSALDSDSEAKVQDALKHLMQDKTVVAIAHRLSTLQYMDRIVFMEEGKIVEDGTHSELLALNGRYANLWHMQSGGFLPSADTKSMAVS